MSDGNNIRGAIEDIHSLDLIDAHELADLIIDLMIGALLHDPAIPGRPYSEMVDPTRQRARLHRRPALSPHRSAHRCRRRAARAPMGRDLAVSGGRASRQKGNRTERAIVRCCRRPALQQIPCL